LIASPQIPSAAQSVRAIGRLRTVALLEGVSFLLLLFVAMPLKYMAGMPMAVRIAGLTHGLLFIGFLVALGNAATLRAWPPRSIARAILAAVLPFGTFVLDRRLRDEQAMIGPGEEGRATA
jgi:integral membrane protein